MDMYCFVQIIKIDHVIGELYHVDNRIKLSYFKLKCLELLLFFSITNFDVHENISLTKQQVKIVDDVKNELINDLESKITIDELADNYGINKTTLKIVLKSSRQTYFLNGERNINWNMPAN